MDVFFICLYIISVYHDKYHSKFHMQKVPFTIQFKTPVGISEKYFLHKPVTHELYLVAIILNISFYTTKSLQHVLSYSLAKCLAIFLISFHRTFTLHIKICCFSTPFCSIYITNESLCHTLHLNWGQISCS